MTAGYTNIITSGLKPASAAEGWRATLPLRLMTMWVLLLASLLPWRTGAYYSGGLDPTVIAKAAVGLAALGLSIEMATHRSARMQLGPRTLVLVGLYVLITLFGAFASGSLLSSGILAVRVVMVAATVALAMVSYPLAQMMRTAMVSMTLVGLASIASGLGSLSHGGQGGVLNPVTPNDIAMLFGPPTIWLLWRMLNGRTSAMHLVVFVGLCGLTYLTGSRTGLIALLLAAFIVLVQAPKLPIGGFLGLIASLPAAYYVVFFTGTFSKFANRGGTGNVTTLNSRTIAWSAAFSAPMDAWQHWFGAGLDVKTVAVSGTYWQTQVLDSSWVSAFVQGGMVGIALLGLLALVSVVAALRAPRPARALLAALVVYALVRSGLENGLVDSYTMFVALLIPTLASELREPKAGDAGSSAQAGSRSTPSDAVLIEPVDASSAPTARVCR